MIARTAYAAIAVLLSVLTANMAAAQLASTCVENSPERRGELGCSIIENKLLPDGLKEPLFWHIDRFDSAERARKMVKLATEGKSQREIARRVHRNRSAVRNVLSQYEMDLMKAIGRSFLLQAVPDLVKRLVKIAKSNDLEAILACLRGLGVLNNRLEVEHVMQGQERNYDFARAEFYHKFRRWPKDIGELIAFDETIDVEPVTIENDG